MKNLSERDPYRLRIVDFSCITGKSDIMQFQVSRAVPERPG